MKRSNLIRLVLLITMCGLTLPTFASDAAPGGLTENDRQETSAIPEPQGGLETESWQFPKSFEATLEELDHGATTPASGCTAEQYCEHGGMVSCTGNSTCTASTWSCGKVTCDGQIYRCAGGCGGPQQCYQFCIMGQGAQDADCEYGCCVCIF